VGDCMKIVENNGNKDNTIFMFTSEQGASMPFGKWTCYNMGLKAAFIARWPKVIKPGTETNILTQYIDVVPTLYQAAGGNPTELRGNIEQTMKLDGKSFYSAFKGDETEVREYVYGLHTTRGIKNGSENYPVRSIHDHHYKLIWNLNYKETFYCSASRIGAKMYEGWLKAAKDDPKALEHVLLYRNRPEFELYNIKEDPYELTNLVADSSLINIKDHLFSALEKWMAEQGDQGIQTEWEALNHFKGDTLNWRGNAD
jgi:N-sulfoglucosamine sulfohydrolase